MRVVLAIAAMSTMHRGMLLSFQRQHSYHQHRVEGVFVALPETFHSVSRAETLGPVLPVDQLEEIVPMFSESSEEPGTSRVTPASSMDLLKDEYRVLLW